MQLTLSSVGGPATNTEWSPLHQALVEAIAIITPKELCWRLGIKEQYLSDAIFERDRKSIKAQWIPTIMGMAPDSARRSILEALSKPYGYDVNRRRERTPEEKLADTIEAVKRRFGVAGLELVEELNR